MKRSLALGLAPLAAAALALAACGSTTEVFPGQPATGISVQGTGEVTAPVDTGTFTAGVEVTAPTVSEARDRAATAASAILEAVKGQGVDDEDIRTIDLQVYPRYETRAEETVLVGYTLVNTIEVKVRDLDSFGDIVDGAIEAGGDDVRINSIRFEIEDIDDLVKQARELAMEDAKAKAGQMADLAGVELGAPVSISEFSSIPYARDLAAPPATGPGTPIMPGTTTVTISVSVLYAIED